MPDWVLHLLGMVFVSGAVYGGIRGELRSLREKQKTQDGEITRLRDRLDACTGCPKRRHGD